MSYLQDFKAITNHYIYIYFLIFFIKGGKQYSGYRNARILWFSKIETRASWGCVNIVLFYTLLNSVKRWINKFFVCFCFFQQELYLFYENPRVVLTDPCPRDNPWLKTKDQNTYSQVVNMVPGWTFSHFCWEVTEKCQLVE